jgi:hypothetical protein
MDKKKISRIEEDLLPAGYVDNGIDITSFDDGIDDGEDWVGSTF